MKFRNEQGRFCRCPACPALAKFVRLDMQRRRERGEKFEHYLDVCVCGHPHGTGEAFLSYHRSRVAA